MQAGSGRDKRDVSLSHPCLHYHYLPLLERSPESRALHTLRCGAGATHPWSRKAKWRLAGPLCTTDMCVLHTASSYPSVCFSPTCFSHSACLLQGCIPLQGSQVNELSANQDEPSRHLFEIVPGELELRQICCVRTWASASGLGQVRTKKVLEKNRIMLTLI